MTSSKDFLSTGDASKLLGISRATVSRMFDKGILHGRKNPITGKRNISRYSVMDFMKQYNISQADMLIEKKRILLVTSDEVLLSLVHKTFADDERIKIEKVTFGCDALILSSKKSPDLLLIDEELPDISGVEVVSSLKRMKELKNIKILCFLKSDKTDNLLKLGVDECIMKDALDKAELTRRVNSLLNIPESRLTTYPVSDHEKRKCPRIAINIPANVKVYNVNEPDLHEPGNGIMENISIGGAYLSQIQLAKGIIPGGTFRLLLEVNQPPMENWKVESKVIRLHFDGSMKAGIQFVNMSKDNENKILEMLNQ